MKDKSQIIFKLLFLACLTCQSNAVFAVTEENTSLFNTINLLLMILVVVIGLLVFKAIKTAKTLTQLQNEVKHLRSTDELTQLFNRRYMEKRLYQIFERHIRNKSANSVLLMIGLDDFQDMLNDNGQSAADLVIQKTAYLIQERIRNTDLCGRFSKNAFIVLLRDTTVEPAQKLAEEIRVKLQDTEILYGKLKLYTTCSIGLAAYNERMVSCRDWIQQVDQALNRTKQLGGNQTTVY